MPILSSRQADLLQWMRARPEHDGRTAPEIVAAISHPYDTLGHYKSARCFDDLRDLAAQGVVRREGRPARWFLEPRGADDAR